ncbi:MAG: hypothetical protein ACFFAN_02770 [Promethearchaeota archaeon]
MNKKVLLIIPIIIITLVASVLFLQLNNKSSNGSNSDDDDPISPVNKVVLKGDRLLGIDVNPASGVDYNAAFDIANTTGMDFVSLSFGWNDIETTPHNYTNEYLEIANYYYPSKNCKIALIIAPIDTNVNRMPIDIKDKPFNDTEVISRYNDMLYNVSDQLKDVDIISLSIGNEVNAYLGSDQNAWANYTDFFNQTSKYARTLWPNTKIGCKTMFKALTVTNKDEIFTLNNFSDVIMTTYYPLNDDFSVKPLSILRKDFDNITQLYENREIYFLEVGYPSNETLGSSNSMQAAFIEEIFRQWDLYVDQVKVIHIVWLHDKSTTEVNDLCNYYNNYSENFKAYLGSIGIRTSDGIDKEAFLKLKNMAQIRSW